MALEVNRKRTRRKDEGEGDSSYKGAMGGLNGGVTDGGARDLNGIFILMSRGDGGECFIGINYSSGKIR